MGRVNGCVIAVVEAGDQDLGLTSICNQMLIISAQVGMGGRLIIVTSEKDAKNVFVFLHFRFLRKCSYSDLG